MKGTRRETLRTVTGSALARRMDEFLKQLKGQGRL
jgi:hypothetical protein